MSSDLRKYAKSWINCNMCDGDDRSNANRDYVNMNMPDLYKMVDELLEDYELDKANEEEKK